MRLFSASEYEFGLIAVGEGTTELTGERGSDYLHGIVD